MPHITSKILLVLAAGLVFVAAQKSTAASLNTLDAPPDQPVWYAEILGHYQWGLARGSEHGQGEMLALGYRLKGPLFLQAEAGHAHIKLKNKNSLTRADVLAVNLMLRWHVLTTSYITFFAEAGMGVLACNRSIPSDGMETNTTPQAGMGVIFPLWNQIQIVLGGRYVHVSHGLWKPNIANPGFNSAGIYGGIHIPF